MISVGVRELKSNLSKYLQLARDGSEVLVTRRGEVVATITRPIPNVRPDLPEGILELARQGRIQLGLPHDPAIYKRMPRIVPDGTAQELLDETRGDR